MSLLSPNYDVSLPTIGEFFGVYITTIFGHMISPIDVNRLENDLLAATFTPEIKESSNSGIIYSTIKQWGENLNITIKISLHFDIRHRSIDVDVFEVQTDGTWLKLFVINICRI